MLFKIHANNQERIAAVWRKECDSTSNAQARECITTALDATFATSWDFPPEYINRGGKLKAIIRFCPHHKPPVYHNNFYWTGLSCVQRRAGRSLGRRYMVPARFALQKVSKDFQIRSFVCETKKAYFQRPNLQNNKANILIYTKYLVPVWTRNISNLFKKIRWYFNNPLPTEFFVFFYFVAVCLL